MSDSLLAHVHLVSCVGVDTEYSHLPHFLAHYRSLGVPVRNMHITLNTDDAGSPNLQHARALLDEHGVAAPTIWIAPYTSESMWARRRAVQQEQVPPDHWVISADVDELHEYPAPLADFLEHCDARCVNCIQGVFIDRLAPDGHLVTVDENQPIQETFPVQADVQCSIAQQGENHNWHGTVKLMAMKGNILPTRCGHHPEDGPEPARYLYGRQLAAFPYIGQAWFRFLIPLRVHHFKWTASMADTLRRRLATPGVSVAGAEYGRKLLDYIEAHGRIRPEDVAIRSSYWLTDRFWRQRTAGLSVLNAAHWYAGRSRGVARRVKKRLSR